MLTDKLNRNEAVVCVAGLGYVGLPLAIEFSKGMRVIGYDIDDDKIKKLNSSELNQENKNLFITNDPTKIRDADFVIISVPTPVTRSQEPDLSHVESAAETVSQNLKRNFLRKNLVKPSDIPLRSSRIIALVNELSIIFEKMGLNTEDVLDAASTKWNFHRYSPGLVGDGAAVQ